jgi:two-component system response regulator AtoC
MSLAADLGRDEGISVVLVTGQATVETAVQALRNGASDYLVKPIDIARLEALLARVPRSNTLRAEIGSLRFELIKLGRFGRLLGKSPPMLELYEQIARVAPTEATVLLQGASGTGKELVAQTLHELSRRRGARFIAIDCGAIAPQSIESEFFGHAAGVSPAAGEPQRGFFEQAEGGTIFLDEITEMPPLLQVKLLRVIETRRYKRLGAEQESSADVRIIAASNTGIEAVLAKGRLRADLYHRLNVFPIRLPLLSARDGDVELLATHFLDELNQAHRGNKRYSQGALSHLLAQAWPGNVRELRNCLLRAYIMADDEIQPRHLMSHGQPGDAAGARADRDRNPCWQHARRRRPPVGAGDTGTLRRQQAARCRNAGHQPEDLVQPTRRIPARRTRAGRDAAANRGPAHLRLKRARLAPICPALCKAAALSV